MNCTKHLPLGVLFLASALSSHAAILTGTGSPTAADPNLRLWLDASDASTLFQDTGGTTPAAGGAAVARWDSKATSTSISTQQGNPANVPLFTTSVGALGGAPAVSFTGGGGGDALTAIAGNSSGISGGGPLTLVTVWQSTGFTSQNYQHTFHMGSTVGNQAYGHSASRGNNAGNLSNHYWGAGFDSTGADAGAPGAGHLGLSTYDGATDSFYYDGAAAGTNAIALNIGLDQLQVGSRLSPFTEGFTGNLAEVILYDSVLSDAERNQLGFYIQNKYGITVDGAVPEPSAALLSLLGLGLFAARRRRKS